jgi:hypothetical protein
MFLYVFILFRCVYGGEHFRVLVFFLITRTVRGHLHRGDRGHFFLFLIYLFKAICSTLLNLLGLNGLLLIVHMISLAFGSSLKLMSESINS